MTSSSATCYDAKALKTARPATEPRKTTTAATYPIAFNGCSFPSFRNHCVLPTIQDKGVNKRAITMPSANNGNQASTASAGHVYGCTLRIQCSYKGTFRSELTASRLLPRSQHRGRG